MKKILALISLLTLLLIGADRPVDTVRLTLINKADMDIAVQLQSKSYECANSKEIIQGGFYYLTVLKGTREEPNVKVFDIQRDNYAMQLYYLQTYDPVYGYKCPTPSVNVLSASHNTRVVFLPCDFNIGPKQVGERTMRKYLPFTNAQYAFIFQRYWLTRLIN